MEYIKKVDLLDACIEVEYLGRPRMMISAAKIGTMPAVDVPDRPQGEWIDRSDGIEGAWNYCSVCGEQAIDLYDFCPNCGAKMDGERKEKCNE